MMVLKMSLAQGIPPRHKTWVIGDEPVIGIDFTNLTEDGKSE
jgi:hypothetical protein